MMKTNAHFTDHVSEREQANRRLSYEIATEGIVLLHNSGVLPLSPCRLALYGAGAGYTIKGGSGSGEVNVRHTVTVLEGLTEAGFDILTHDWIDRYDRLWRSGKETFLQAIRRKLWWPTARVMDELMAAEYRYPAGDALTADELAACETDTCVYVVSRQSGEGHDLKDVPGSFRLEETELHNIRLCAGHFARFILVINTGVPIDLSPLDEMSGIDAIVYMAQLGMDGGRALASVLTGACCPSGKLTVTWPQTYGNVPYGNEFAHDPASARYKEGIYVGYRYYDSFDVSPRYPFGYGLSYTEFAIRPVGATLAGDSIHCSVQVTNTGKRFSGKEVVQLYVRCPGDDREYQRLAAFAKTAVLAPGQQQSLELSFPLSALACYDEQQAVTLLTAGQYLLSIGNSSRQTTAAACIRIGKQVVLCRHRNLCAAAAPIAELHHANTFDIPEGLPVLTVDTDSLATVTADYTPQAEHLSEQTQTALAGLSTEECIKFCAGTGMSGEDAGFRTPGAVGHTTTEFISRGIPNVQMCDGPAGVRLEKRAVQYPNGKIRAVDISISVYEYLPKFLLRWFILGDPDKGQMLYQFVTGFPIAAVVAQTWNTALAEQMGRAVSEEMSEYGVTFWLAPAMNIVRNPLCGRNFEYFSEDPLLTGLLAAAITNGVQATPGNYVTLKHFSANNQESNRYTMSSDVDERTLREIYWRGFELAVRLSQPRAVMAAYNRLNGTFCANSHELCTDLLRGEWGFSGVVMTDWMSTGKDRADEAGCVLAGVDLIMPGSKDDLKALRKACQNGQLTDADIRRAAGRVIQAIMDSKSQTKG